MRFSASSVILATCCLWSLTLPACSMRMGGAAKPVAAAPPPAPPARRPVETAAAEPISVPQTQVTLPNPQPIQAEALEVVKVEPPPTAAPPTQPAKPRPTAPRTEPRQQATTVQQTTPAGPQPPPAARPRIRPVESDAERNRFRSEIATRQKQVNDNLAKAMSRPLSEAEKIAVERIKAFLDQTEAALKDQDFQQAAALSNRALLLSQDLNSEK